MNVSTIASTEKAVGYRSPRKSKKTTTTNTPAANNGATGIAGTGMTFGNLFGYLLIVLFVLGLIGLLTYTISRAEIDLDGQSRAVAVGDSAPDSQTIERMKHLPAELRRTDVNMRSEALRLMEAGEHEQAIILLFGHQLLLLDASGHLRLTRGKTNGRYVREARRTDRDAGDCLRLTATAFERSYFGRHRIENNEMLGLWKNNEKLERLIQAQQEAAA